MTPTAKKHIALYALAYIGIMFLIVMVPYWRDLDMLIFGQLHRGSAGSFSSEILVVDLPYSHEQRVFRDRIAQFLQAIVDSKQTPIAVVFDVYFTAANADANKQLKAAIDRLRSSGAKTKLYAAINPLDQSGNLDPNATNQLDIELYRNYFDGAGHTLFYYEFGTLWYDSELALSTTKAVPALPMQVAIDFDREAPRAHPGQIVMRVGEKNQIKSATVSFDGSPQSLNLDEKFVVVGSIKSDIPPATWRSRSGPELLAWALNDHIRRGESSRRELAPSPWLLVALTLVCSTLSACVFLGLFQRLHTRRSALWKLFVAASAVGIVFLGLLVLGLSALDRIYPRVTLAALGILTASALGWDYVRKRIWDDMFDPNKLSATQKSIQYCVFISYSHEPANVDWVRRNIHQPLLALLSSERIFFDKKSLEPGMLWFRRLGTAIDESAIFVPIYSEDYFVRGFCLWERDLAEIKLVKQKDFKMYPILHGQCDVPVPYRQVQWADANNNPDFFEGLKEKILSRGGVCVILDTEMTAEPKGDAA